MSFEHLHDDIENLLNEVNNNIPFSADSLGAIASKDLGKNCNSTLIIPLLNECLNRELIKRYNPDFQTFHGNGVSHSERFIISSKGKEYLKNLNFENEKINRDKETLKIAKRASTKSNIANLIAILSLLFGIISFFYNQNPILKNKNNETINDIIDIPKLNQGNQSKPSS
ncbi:MAG: hypothetical protein ACRCXX_09760 [Cetobacterium sp.]|uniref:hypothetical protein n=1 Tax=Cetobacterium sp. TaxID=2071632 RepID=UPI003F3EB2D2